jgi:hypothetical protein
MTFNRIHTCELKEGNSNSNDQVQIDIVLDRGRFNNLVDMCNK